MGLLKIAAAVSFAALLVLVIPSTALGTPSLKSCRIAAADARCGTVAVLEDRAGGPNSRTIELRVVVLPTSAATTRPALFVVNGGPGAATVGMAELFFNDFALARRDRDVVLIDQRGTGGSNPLRCRVAQGHAVLPENPARCLGHLSKIADLRFYGTDAAVRDLDDVRTALGYERIDILGISYGTRIAWWYAKSFPARVRALVLVSPNPPSQRLLESVGEDSRRALRLLAADCRVNRECRVRFPDFEDGLRSVDNTLTPGQRIALPLLLYSVGETRRLPWMVNEAFAGNTQPLNEALASALDGGQRQISLGLHLTVQCSEEFAINRRVEDDRLAAALWDEYATACRDWLRIPVPRGFRDSFRSEARALVISGEWDPATPPRWADEMARFFLASTVMVIPKGTHGLSDIGKCLDRAVTQFLDERPPQTQCMGSMASRRYFVP